MASPDYGPAGKPPPDRIVEYTFDDATQVPAIIVEIDIETSECILAVFDVDHDDMEGFFRLQRRDEVRYDPSAGPDSWRWYPRS